MPLYDFSCSSCKKTEEHVENINTVEVPCECGGVMAREFSFGRRFVPNEDSPWIRSITDIVDKDSRKPHVVEFLKNPTRENYKNWLKGEKLRHIEPGEKAARPPETVVTPQFVNEIARKRFERRALGEIR